MNFKDDIEVFTEVSGRMRLLAQELNDWPYTYAMSNTLTSCHGLFSNAISQCIVMCDLLTKRKNELKGVNPVCANEFHNRKSGPDETCPDCKCPF